MLAGNGPISHWLVMSTICRAGSSEMVVRNSAVSAAPVHALE